MLRPHTSTVAEFGALFALVDLGFHQKLSRINSRRESLAISREGLGEQLFSTSLELNLAICVAGQEMLFRISYRGSHQAT